MGENENNTANTQDLRAQLEAAFAQDDAGTGAENAVPAENVADSSSAPDSSAEQNAPAEQTETVTPESAAAEESPAPAEAVQNPAASVPASGAASQMDTMMQMVSRTAEMLRSVQEENQRLRSLVGQQSEAAQNAVQAAVEDKTPKPAQPPVFDLSRLQYMDDEARAAASADYTAQLTSFIRSQMEGELAPIREDFERQKASAERESAIGALSNDSSFVGFAEALPKIERILQSEPALSSEGDMQKRYAIAYLISRGMDAMQPKEEVQRSAADIAKEAIANPEVMRLIESERARQIAEKNADVPRQMASSGTATAPATPQAKPKTMEEAREFMRRSFGL